MKLRKELQNYPELYSRLQVIETKARQLLEFSQGGAHLTYTPHGFSHISAVESNYDWLLSDEDISKSFNAAEIFCLLCATFFHDAFMIPQKIGDEEMSRRYHASKASEYLLRFKESLTLNIHEASIISEIILGHAIEDFNSLRPEVALNSQLIEIRKLAACLSMADICHADYRRAPEVVFQYLNLNEDSAFHWRRHLQISGITRKFDYLIMSAIYFTDEGFKAVENYKKEIEKQLEIVKPFFHSKLNPIVRIDLQAQKLKSELDIKLRFQANTPAILDMLIEGVYQRGDVLIRELVQNGLDACLLRSAKAMRRTELYQPALVITFLSERGQLKGIRIDDNGIGMDIIDVQDTVLWIGNSISQRSDVNNLLQETTQKKLIATFGIGLLSCFKSAKQITIRSRKEGNEALEFQLSTISDEIKPKESGDTSIGSTFIIELKDEYCDEIDSFETIEYYFRLIKQVSLQVLYLDWDNNSLALSRSQIMKIASTEGNALKFDALADFHRDIFYVEVKGDDFVGWFGISPGSDKDSFPIDEGRITILNEGVYVSNDDSTQWLPPFLGMCHGIINFSARAIDLPVSRDKVVNNKKNVKKRSEISKRVVVAVIDKLVEISSNTTTSEIAALILSWIYKKAPEEMQLEIIKQMDHLYVSRFKSPRNITLRQIRDLHPQKIYLEYNVGRYVDDLTMFEGKELYHKPDDIIKLQAALFHQDGEIVLSCSRTDFTEEKILESAIIEGYFAYHKIKTVDLRTENVIKGYLRSKPVSARVRNEIGSSIKFILVEGLPQRKAWRVDNEIWINLANSQMNKVYELLQSNNFELEHVSLAKILISILSYQFEDAINGVLELIDDKRKYSD